MQQSWMDQASKNEQEAEFLLLGMLTKKVDAAESAISNVEKEKQAHSRHYKLL